ncbi:MAG: hypothetical protein ACJ74J_11570 [Blastocatellia bacterium]
MKRLLIVSSVICLLALAAQAGAPANFGGIWSLDKSKSEGLQGRMAQADITMTVTQDAKQLTVETSYSGSDQPPQKLAYHLDGSETTAEMMGRGGPSKATLKAKWASDSVLELHSVRNANFQGNDVTITTTEHWELADGGKTLTVHRTMETPQGSRDMKLVFMKK